MNMREIFERQVSDAWKNKELSDEEYKGLITEDRESGETGDDFNIRMFNKLAGIHADKLFARILKGAEYIDSIGKDHPHYAKSMSKYDELVGRMQLYESKKERGDEVITRWDIYTRMRKAYIESDRRMSEEELQHHFPNVDIETIRNGITEFDCAVSEALKSTEGGFPYQTFEEETQ